MNSGVPSHWVWAESPRPAGLPSAVAVRPCEARLASQLRTRQDLASPEDDKTVLPLLSSGRRKCDVCPLAVFKAVGLKHCQVVTQVVRLILTCASLEVGAP